MSQTVSGAIAVNDPDTDDSVSSYVISAGPVYGSARINVNSGTWVYTPTIRPADYADFFAVTVTDGGNNTAIAYVNIYVSVSGGDIQPPTVSAVSPSNGAIDVAVDTAVVVTFSEEINTGSLTYAATPDPGGWSATWSSGGTVATLNHNLFTYQTVYTISVTAADDLAGNPLSGAPVEWSFTTISTTDTTSPTLVAVSPPNGAEDVAAGETVVITFSEAIDSSSLTYSATPDPGGWSAAWSNNGIAATLSHNPFASQTMYTVTVTAANDLADNPLANAPYAWHFGTGQQEMVYLPLVLRNR
jgi:VCBS repeat-containing protein